MRTYSIPDNELLQRVQLMTQGKSLDALARATHVHRETLQKVLAGKPVDARSLAKLARIAPRIRTADEFKDSLSVNASPRQIKAGAFSWSLERIREARDAQMLGDFAAPFDMARMMRADDAIFVARSNRLAPQKAIAAKLVGCGGVRGERAAKRAANSVFVTRGVLSDIHGTLVDHGVAIGYNDLEPSDDGTQVDFRLREWPINTVKYDARRNVLTTRDADGAQIDIVHGDGHWTIFREAEIEPWTKDACIIPACLVWAAHGEGISDWAGATRAHGLAKILGMLQAGTPLTDSSGALTPEAQAFLQLLIALANGDSPAGIAPPGSTVEFLSNDSTAWQVFAELITNREKAAARIYQGTDAALGSQGGAPGIDISKLFDVASTKIQSDLSTIEQCLDVGVYQPWCAINDGDSTYAPSLRYQIPDPDADARRAQQAAAYVRLFEILKGMRDQKLQVTQEVIDAVAKEQGISPIPQLADVSTQSSTVVLAPADVAKVVRVVEARAAQGLPPFGDERDNMTITELDALMQAKATAQSTPAPTPAPTTP